MAKRRRQAAPGPAADVPAPPPFFRRDEPRLFLAALALRLLHLWLHRGDFWLKTPLLDDNLFVSWAEAIRREGWLVPSLGVFDLNPAYPYLLALLGAPGPLAVFALQHLLGAAAVVVLYRVALSAFGRPAALAAGVLAALYGPAVFYESRFLGECWILAANAAWLFCLLRAREAPRPGPWWALGGLCLGVSAVFRPNALILLPAAAAWGAWTLKGAPRRLAACAALFALGVWLPLLPFQLRNRALDPSRGWGLTTSSGGANFYLGNNPEADGLNQAPSFIRYGPGHQYQDFKEEAQRRAGRALSPREVSRYWLREALRWMAAEPGAAARLWLRKAGFFLNRKEPPDNFFLALFERFTRLGPLPLAGWGLVLPLGLAGLALSLGDAAARRSWLLHAYALSYFGVNVAFYILSRYRFPAAAAFLPFAGYAAARLAAMARARVWTRRELALAGLCLGAFGLSRLPLIGGEDLAVTNYSMGVIYANRGLQDEAAAAYRASIAANPAFPAPYLNLGILEARRGNAEAAAAALEGALRLERDPEKARLLAENIRRLRR